MRAMAHVTSGGHRIHSIKNYTVDVCFYLLLAVWTIFLHYPALKYGWLFDDLQILKHAVEYHPREYFLVPRIWQELSVSNLTPWVTLSFDVDLGLFGMEPRFFYIHQFFSLWLCLVTLYAVLRLWVPRSYAFCGSFLASVSAPVMFSAEFLCLRHYVEGAALILLSLLLFVIALRRKNMRIVCLSAIFYFFAMTAKEIYVPFILVLLFLPEAKWSVRLKFAVLHFVAFFLYFLWRFWMLGRVIGGYQSELLNINIFSEMYRIAIVNTSESIKMLAGVSTLSDSLHLILFILTFLLFGAAFIIYMRKKKFFEILFILIVILSVYAPISPSFIFFSIHTFDSYRFLFLFSIVYASLVVVIAHRLSYSLMQSGVSSLVILKKLVPSVAAIMACIIFVSSYQWLSTQRELTIQPLIAEGKFLMNADEDSVMVKTALLPVTTYYEMLNYFRILHHKQRIPHVVYDIFFDIRDNPLADLKNVHVYKYSRDGRVMVEITREFVQRRKDFLARIRTLPFRIKFTVKDGRFSYQLGPSDTGRYFLLGGYRSGMYDMLISSLGRTLTNEVHAGKVKRYVRFGWESPEGSVTFSPEWFIDFSKDQEISWSQ